MSGIFLFMVIYKDLTTDPKATEWTDDQIRDKILSAVIGGRAHAIFSGKYRVWDEWKEPTVETPRDELPIPDDGVLAKLPGCFGNTRLHSQGRVWFLKKDTPASVYTLCQWCWKNGCGTNDLIPTPMNHVQHGNPFKMTFCDCDASHSRLGIMTCGKCPPDDTREHSCSCIGELDAAKDGAAQTKFCCQCGTPIGNKFYCRPCAIIRDLCTCGEPLKKKYSLSS
jgi:hypothetical protein